MPKKLNQAVAEALKPGDRPYVCYGAPSGFGCRVTPNGVRSWIFDYRPGGGRHSATRRMTLGRGPLLRQSAAPGRGALSPHSSR